MSFLQIFDNEVKSIKSIDVHFVIRTVQCTADKEDCLIHGRH